MRLTVLTRGIVWMVVAALPVVALADGIFDDSYDEVFGFTDAAGLEQTRMNACYDGVNAEYWSSSGGSPGGNRLARYDSDGNLQTLYQPGIDMRSVFTEGDTEPVYARGYASPQIRVQTSPGVFGNDVTLSGGTLNSQSAVVFTTDGQEFRAMNAGTVTRWDRDGKLLGTIALSGFGSQNNENAYPQNRGMASADVYMLTYANGVLSGWDDSGDRVGTTKLNGAGNSFDSHFSISYANAMVFVVDSAGGRWRGYDVGLGGGGGGKCSYTIKKSKAKKGCESCPAKGEGFESEARCEVKKDCKKKVKTTITCPQGKGTCKIKAKKRKCGN